MGRLVSGKTVKNLNIERDTCTNLTTTVQFFKTRTILKFKNYGESLIKDYLINERKFSL